MITAINPDARTLLDVACGTGGHLVHLQRSFDVAGLDLDEAMLDVARSRLPGVDLVRADMQAFDLARTFDAIVCLFSSIGHLADAATLAESIACMSRHLATGGVLIVDGWVRPAAWIEPGVADLVGGVRDDIVIARVGRSERQGNKTILELHHTVGTESSIEHFVEHHELTLFTDDEYRHAFTSAGLDVDLVESPMPERDRYIGITSTER